MKISRMTPQGPIAVQLGQPTLRPDRERRRRPRHRLRLPAYTQIGNTSPATELCEVIDLNQDGMSIQSAASLMVGLQPDLRIDLEEGSGPVQASGTVIWASSSGRAGIRFAGLAPAALRSLQEWLFADVLAACADVAEDKSAAHSVARRESETDRSSVLAALAAVQKEIEAIASDFDASVHLIARRACVFTASHAAAVGLKEGEEMICRATAGANAPSIGARLRSGSGFSAECVRSGILLRCDDSETDPRVDRDSCRALGIRSMLAAPVRMKGGVIGLIEVFSSHPCAYQSNDEFIVQRLAEMVSFATLRSRSPDLRPSAILSVDDEFPVETPADLPIQFPNFREILFATLAMSVLLCLLWAIQHFSSAGREYVNTGAALLQQNLSQAPADKLDSLQKLAVHGDPAAQFDLGVRYWSGNQVQQDYAQAVRWFTLSGEQGNVAAESMLSDCFRTGRGVAADSAKAYYWALLAQAGGDTASSSRLTLLASQLNASQIADTEKKAGDWIMLHPRATKSVFDQ